LDRKRTDPLLFLSGYRTHHVVVRRRPRTRIILGGWWSTTAIFFVVIVRPRLLLLLLLLLDPRPGHVPGVPGPGAGQGRRRRLPPPRGGVGNVEQSDHDRTISMTVFFLVLGVLYIGFCAYYRHRNKARRVMGDNNAEGGGGGAANMEGSRRRQRLENQASALSFSLTLRVCVCHVVSLLVPN